MTDETIDNVIYLEFDDSLEETYRLALESAYRWLLRTDELDPMDVIRVTKKVIKAALEDV